MAPEYIITIISKFSLGQLQDDFNTPGVNTPGALYICYSSSPALPAEPLVSRNLKMGDADKVLPVRFTVTAA